MLPLFIMVVIGAMAEGNVRSKFH